MIKLKNEVFDNEEFSKGLEKLYNNESLDSVTTYKIANLFQVIGDKSFAFFEAKVKLLKQNGKVDPGDANARKWVINEDKYEEFVEGMRNLHNIEIELNVDLIPYDEKMKLSGGQMNALRGILDFSELQNR